MARKHFRKSGGARWLWSLSGLTLLAGRAQAQYDPDWTSSFRLGALVGLHIKASFSMSGSAFGISGNGAGGYADGYVKKDNGGALTFDWGYQHASQYNAAKQTLTMDEASSFNATESGANATSTELGAELSYGGSLWHKGPVRVGWEAGFGYLPITISDSTPLLNASVISKAYTFDASGIIMPPPGYQGQPNSPGPGGGLISSSPIGPPVITTNASTSTTITGTRTLDVTLFTLRLGPTVFLDLTRRFGLQIGAGPAIGLVTGDLKYSEMVNSTPNVGQIGQTKLTYGGYVNGMITYHLDRNGDLFLGAQYMPMKSAKFSGDGREADLKLGGGLYLTAGINWPF